MSALKDLTGQRFGRWTVLERVARPQFTTSTSAFYRCLCDCGTERIICGVSLRNGDSRSCGCFRNDICRERLKRLSEERKRLKEEAAT